MRRWTAAVVRLALLTWMTASSCTCGEQTGGILVVDLRTDLVPGVEFASVRTEVFQELPTDRESQGLEVEEAARLDADYFEGKRLGEFHELPRGDLTVVVSLLDTAGAVKAERPTRLTLRSARFAVTVLITRDCAQVQCPLPDGDPGLIACLGGECVDPHCSVETPELCPPDVECLDAAACSEHATCAEGECVAGVCVYREVPGECDDLLDYCEPSVGCIPQMSRLEGCSRELSLVWTGSEYAAAWDDVMDIHFARIDEAGDVVAEAQVTTTDTAASRCPSLVSTADGYGVAWQDERDGDAEIHFVRLDEAGVRVGAEVSITSDPGSSEAPGLVWTGSGFGLVWNDDRDGNDEIYFAKLDDAGALESPEVRLTNARGGSGFASLAGVAGGFGLSWADNRDQGFDIYFARLDEAGALVDQVVRITNGPYPALFPTLAANADGFGLAWSDSRDGNAEVYFVRLDDAGLLLGAEVRVTNEPLLSASPSLVWMGSGYGVAWDDRQDDQGEILFGQLDEAGALLGAVVSVTDSQGHSWFPSVAWSGTRYGVAWRLHDEGASSTQFVTIAP